MTYDAATIAAFVDGELDDISARRLERAAEDDSALAQAIARHRALKSRLTAHYNPILNAPVPDRLTALLARSDTVDDSFGTRLEKRQDAATARLRFNPRYWGAIAASLVLGLTIGTSPWTPAQPVISRDGALIASGSLAKALDTQLASTQPANSLVRIGLSFKAKDGRYCRTFDSAAIAGIGCHADGAWMLEQTLSGTQQSDYRQAGSGALVSTAVEMMAGEPLDATTEAAAKAKGW